MKPEKINCRIHLQLGKNCLYGCKIFKWKDRFKKWPDVFIDEQWKVTVESLPLQRTMTVSELIKSACENYSELLQLLKPQSQKL